jgi:uncharacterized LabA/DUF88 family protein
VEVLRMQEPVVKNVMGFIDGQNLFHHAKDAFGYTHPNYDPKKLLAAVCQPRGWRPTLARFYTGVPLPNDDPVWSAYWNNKLLAMRRAGVHVTSRPLRYHIEGQDRDGENIVSIKEKGIDVRLALDVVRLARQRQFDVAVIFSQDQDLREVVAEVRDIAAEQNRYIKLVCAYPAGANASAIRGINGTDWFAMDREFDQRDHRPRKR